MLKINAYIVGNRVILNTLGIRHRIDGRKSGLRTGTVLGISKRQGCLRICWDGSPKLSKGVVIHRKYLNHHPLQPAQA